MKRGSTWNTPQSRNCLRIFGAPSSKRKLSGLINCNGRISASCAALRAFWPSIRIWNSPCRSREMPSALCPPSASSTWPKTVQLCCSCAITGLSRTLRNERASPSKWMASSTLVFPLPLAPYRILMRGEGEKVTGCRLRTAVTVTRLRDI